MESMNEHLKEIGSQSRIIAVTPGTVVSAADKKNNICYKAGCGKSATHIGNFACSEKLMCDTHTDIFKQKNGQLPADLWYCKKL